MNTVTRAIGSQTVVVSVGSAVSWLLRYLWPTLILLSLFVSALAIVYTKDLNRRLFIQAQALTVQNAELEQEWSKLILERSTLVQQDRLHRAASAMGMIMPGKKVVRVVRSE